MGSFARGFACYFRGFGLVLQPGIRVFAFLPMVLGVLVQAGLVWLLASFFSDAVATSREALPSWFAWLEPLLWILFASAAFFFFVFTFLLTVSLVAAPFNAFISEAVEHHLTGRRPPSQPWLRMLARLPVVLVQETGKILYFIVWALLLLLLYVVPVVQVAAPFLWLFFSAWICALDACDYPMDNNGLPFREMRARLRERLPMTLGFGAAMLLVVAVPLAGIIAIPVGVCGATIMWVEHLRPVRVPPGP